MGLNASTYPMCIFIAVGNGCVDTSMTKFFLAEDYFGFFKLRKLETKCMIYIIFLIF